MCGVTTARNPKMPGRSAAAANSILSCDSAREGQACIILHIQSAEITDLFAKPKQGLRSCFHAPEPVFRPSLRSPHPIGARSWIVKWDQIIGLPAKPFNFILLNAA